MTAAPSPVVRRVVLALVAVIALVWAVNSSWLAPGPAHGPFVFAHRGLGQTFSPEGVDNDTCTARVIHPPEHPYIEDTIPGIAAAVDAGAQWVEIDVQLSADGYAVVFHDADLSCRTEGAGPVRDHTLAELRALDVGHGYTADGGATYPLRGTGVGLLPTLDEVLAAFPSTAFALDFKTGGAPAGDRAATLLDAVPADVRGRFLASGDHAAVDAVRARHPEVRSYTRAAVKRCGLRYLAVGWTGYVPDACRHAVLMVPISHAPLLWGWPRRLQARMDRVDTLVVVIGPWERGQPTTGVDDLDTLGRIPAGFSGGVWTNRPDVIGPALPGARGPAGVR